MKRTPYCKMLARSNQAVRRLTVRVAGWHSFSIMRGRDLAFPDNVLTIEHIRRAVEVLKANNVPPNKDDNYTLYVHVGVKGWDY